MKIPTQYAYLILVISFTLAGFSKTKFYTTCGACDKYEVCQYATGGYLSRIYPEGEDDLTSPGPRLQGVAKDT